MTPTIRNDDRLSRGADDWSEADYLSQTQFNADERAVAAYQLEELRRRLGAAATGQAVAERAHRQLLASDIRRFSERDWEQTTRVRRPVLPPGSPIGDH